MAISTADSSLLLYWPLDEPYDTSIRLSKGSVAYHMFPYLEATGGNIIANSCPLFPDGLGGYALVTGGGQGLPGRYFMEGAIDTVANHVLAGVLPPFPAAVGQGLAFGARFELKNLSGEAGATHPFLSYMQAGSQWSSTRVRMYLGCNAGTLVWGPTSGGQLGAKKFYSGEAGLTLLAGAYWDAGVANYLAANSGWYTMLVSYKRVSATEIRAVGVLRQESTGNYIAITWSINNADTEWDALDNMRWLLAGRDVHDNSAYGEWRGGVDAAWVYAKALEDDEAIALANTGISLAWVPPSYRQAPHDVHASFGDGQADFPPDRQLPVGQTRLRFPASRQGMEGRFRVSGWRPGRPWCVKEAHFVFDPAGPYGSQHGSQAPITDLSIGLWRSPGPKPQGAIQDLLNVIHTEGGPRRRRGFKVWRDVDDTYEYALNSFRSWRAFNNQLFFLYKVGTSLYRETGVGVEELSTGWAAGEIPSTVLMGDRLAVLSVTKRVLWDGSATVGSISIAAPTSIARSLIAGSLNASYYYAATWLDPATGDESGPVVSTIISPSTQGVRVFVTGTPPEARFTQLKIYRTFADGSPPTLTFIDTVTYSASPTTYDDTGEPDGTDLLDQVTDINGLFLGYVTSVPPEPWKHGIIHKGRAFYVGTENPERFYWTEPGSLTRIYASSWQAAHGGPITALASWQGRLLVFTANTVEMVEGDFIRDDTGNTEAPHTTISDGVGAVGPHAVVVYGGEVAWFDRRGIYTLRGTNAEPLSGRIRDLFPYVNHGLAKWISGGWDPVSREVWFTYPSADLEDSTRFQRQFAFDPENPEKWAIHGLEASFVGQFDGDDQGILFGAIDHLGVMKRLDAYEGDGAQGDEAFVTEDEGTDDFAGDPLGITSIVGRVVTVEGAPGWTTDELRGLGVVLRDRSTKLRYYYTIASNTSGTFTVERDPAAALAAGDGYYIGGIDAWFELAASNFGTPNRKTFRQVQLLMADLTQQDLFK